MAAQYLVPVSIFLGLLTACGPEAPARDLSDWDEDSEALVSDICAQPPSMAPGGPTYSGKLAWDGATGRLAFLTSGSFPEGTSGNQHREFHFRPGPQVKTIVVCKNVTLRGHFVVDHAMTIRGRDRKTSVIYGTDTVDWSHAGGRQYRAWEYPAIAGVGSGATISVRNLTIRNARSYAISGWDQRIDVYGVDFVHDRPNDENGSNSDGVQGANGSVVRNSYFNLGDDAIKLYNDMLVEDVVIDMQRNGAPIQLGWDQYGSRSATGTFKNLTINGVARNDQYNLAVLTWVNDGGKGGTKTLNFDGLVVNGLGAAQRWAGSGWEPFPLVQAAGAAAGQLRVNVAHARIATGQFGRTTPRGSFTVCGSTLRQASYDCSE